jgi:hypothetical protein
MWPTEHTIYYLVFGLLPFCYIFLQVWKYGWMEMTSLKIAFVSFTWVAYHLTPWLSFIEGKLWDSSLLVPEMIDLGLVFSASSIIGFLFGYEYILKNSALNKFKVKELQIPTVKASHLVLLSVLVITAFIIVVGPENIWVSSLPRGFGQFEKRDLTGKLIHMLNVILTPLAVVLICMASVYILQRGGKIFNYVIGFLFLCIGSLMWFHGFSRSSGIAFIIFAFIALRWQGKRAILISLIAVLIAAKLGQIGYYERGNYYPGLASFTHALLFSSSIKEQDDNQTFFLDASSNPLNSIDPWTLKVYMKSVENPELLNTALSFLWNQNPLPSELVPLNKIGAGLAEVMGTVGSTGITTPTLGEIYYVFGFLGVFLFIIIGLIFGFFEKWNSKRPSTASYVCVLLCFISVPLGIHSHARAMTRPLVYALVIYIIVSWLDRKYKYKKPLFKTIAYRSMNITKFNSHKE